MPSSLLSLATIALVASPAVATNYNMLYNFDQSNFFQNFSFFSDADPTGGFVQYLDYDAASKAGLAKIKSGNVYLGADSTNTYTTGGRPSTRVTSNVQFDQGLLIADIAHMPGNACGVWPAFWTTGADWPADGEIDIIEGINKQANTQLALHTLGSCDITKNPSGQTGLLTTTACSTQVGPGGCTVQGTDGSYGDGFNNLGGGVYAVELTSSFLKVWFFPRSKIPACITSGNPDTSLFGKPMAVYEGSCDFASNFKNQQIIFNTDFCGDWAGNSYSCPLSKGLSPKASCEAYVGANPSAFTEAYWEIVSVGLYQQGSASTSSASQTTAATSTAATSTAAASTAPATTPTSAPTTAPTSAPTSAPTTAPTTAPASTPSASPSSSPVRSSPSGSPSSQPVVPSSGSGSSSSSTGTVTSMVNASSSARVAPKTRSCTSKKSTVTVTSLTSPAVPVQTASPTSSKLTTTTVIVTTYVDVCPTGYTTKTITQTVTYCPADVTSSSIAPVFTTTSKLCTTGCAPRPTTVIVVVPVETSTTPAQATGTSPGSGSSPALGSETGTSPALGGGPAPVSTKTGITTAASPVHTGIFSTGGLVLAAPSSAIVPAGAKPSSSLPGGGTVTKTGVSPAFTGAGNRIAPSAAGFIAAVAGIVLFI
ncbi:hypothetical protein TMatcc_004356 [Talaromyces marneffei ATCC 18224]|uniref:endo-1,3(4)-beta-glucanase n=2 Tax=Talaromyces marneffei TaxID=37727 RepID=B6Q516_TALMQ|nr:uncharacterized protein EYB26_000690 [Talaromyces marneffei]EEA27359.1 GPI anchored endo-1,3(4)-beta-glucanase, putative [Talaromyces marneffei ATCC 18224]KAE8556938.1 hypothetical protein EYB25_001644 [Talaromyces marneffei]QGA13045.1 hypothetical protein EYB26_000690 [Talaromyces marneffei]